MSLRLLSSVSYMAIYIYECGANINQYVDPINYVFNKSRKQSQ